MNDKSKVVFAHDHRLREIYGKYYSLGGLADYVTERYTNVFDELTLLCRAVSSEEADKKLFEIKNPKVKVTPIKGVSLFLTPEKIKTIENTVKASDGLIVRLPSIIGLVSIHYARKYKKKYLVEVVANTFGSYWYKNLKGKFVAIPLNFLIKCSVKSAPFVLYVTNNFLQKKYPNKNCTIGCSDVFLKETDIKILKYRIDKINQSYGITLGTLGQVDQRYKGHDSVIKAIGMLKKEGITVRYKMAGSGDNSYLKSVAKAENVEDQIEFCGVIPHENIYDWLDDIDVYIQPSKTEGMPRSVIESISRACPTLVSSVGGMYELVSSECTFKAGDYTQIAELIMNLSKNQLIEIAKSNFEKGKEFASKTLNDKRRGFYESFKSAL